MWQGWLVGVWWQSAIVLVVFRWVGLVVGDLHSVDLVVMCEDLCWLSEIIKLDCGNLVNLLEFVDIFPVFRRDVQARGRVFA